MKWISITVTHQTEDIEFQSGPCFVSSKSRWKTSPSNMCFHDLPDGEGLHPFSSEMPQVPSACEFYLRVTDGASFYFRGAWLEPLPLRLSKELKLAAPSSSPARPGAKESIEWTSSLRNESRRKD